MTAGYVTLEQAGVATDEEARTRHPTGSYVTDGTNLYRIAAWLARPMGPDLAEVEDCQSLERVLVRGDDLLRLNLRLVRAGAEAIAD